MSRHVSAGDLQNAHGSWQRARPHVRKEVLKGLRKAEVEAFATARFMELRGSEKGEVEQLREYGRALRAARKALS